MDEVRDELMPVNRRWAIDVLMETLRNFPLVQRKRITIEYVLLDGVNDSDDDARRLIRLLAGIPVKINLLPLNAHDRTELRPPPDARVDPFQAILRKAGLNAIVRTARGREISAA